jgi:hypothetical protein
MLSKVNAKFFYTGDNLFTYSHLALSLKITQAVRQVKLKGLLAL